MTFLGPQERERRLRAYESTRNDAQAAQSLGLKHSAFTAWRYREGLTARSAAKALDRPTRVRAVLSRISEREHARRLAAYERSASDSGAAKRLGVSPKTFTRWRTTRRLPPRGRSGTWLNPREDARRLRAYRKASNDSAAARLLNMSVATFNTWRNKKKLPPKGKIDEEHRYAVLRKHASVTAAARELGIRPSTLDAWTKNPMRAGRASKEAPRP